jgi:hypothetical protein
MALAYAVFGCHTFMWNTRRSGGSAVMAASTRGVWTCIAIIAQPTIVLRATHQYRRTKASTAIAPNTTQAGSMKARSSIGQ